MLNVSGNVTALDTQIAGVHDDGSNSGVVRTKLSQGELVKQPLRPGQYQAITFGTSTVASQTAGYMYNEDGSGLITVLTSQAGLNQGCGIQFQFYGRVLGIRWYRQRTTVPTFCVVVDGVAYAVNNANSTVNNIAPSGTMSDEECSYVIVDDLPDANSDGTALPHTAIVLLPAQPVGGSAATLYLFGVLVEKRLGYSEKPRLLLPVTGTVSTSANNITQGPSTDQTIRSVRKIMYFNTDSVAHVVTIQMSVNGSAAVTSKKIYLTATGTNGDSAEVDFGDRALPGSDIKHLADAASVVNYAALAGY